MPDQVREVLGVFVDAAKEVFGPTLRSIILFGSAAEGRLRKTSNINLIVFLSELEPPRLAQLRPALRVAHAAAGIEPMFVLESEAPVFIENLGLKSTDVLRTRTVLFGSDPFLGLELSRDLVLRQLTQAVFQLRLRLRNQYVSRGMREEQLAIAIADAAGPLRSIAAAVLELDRIPFESRKAALEVLVKELRSPDTDVLARISEARERAALPPGIADAVLLQLLALCDRIDLRLKELAKPA